MRKINELVWHCTATPEGREVSVKEIDRWHKQRGWSGIGYHKVVHLDGTVSEGRPESKVGAHVAGRNTGTLGYVYVGGVATNGKTPKDTRTPAQKATMLRLTREAIAKYGITKVSGHNQYAAKACPCFPAAREYEHLLSMNGAAGMPAKDPAALSKSRTLIGASMTGVGTVGSTVTEAAEQIAPLAGFSTTLTVLFILLTLIGIGVVVYARLDDAGALPTWLRRAG